MKSMRSASSCQRSASTVLFSCRFACKCVRSIATATSASASSAQHLAQSRIRRTPAARSLAFSTSCSTCSPSNQMSVFGRQAHPTSGLPVVESPQRLPRKCPRWTSRLHPTVASVSSALSRPPSPPACDV
eukprot:scaffold205972_cov32-Tisochrysis_lutea.AAC.3